jgi:hypothetical protein
VCRTWRFEDETSLNRVGRRRRAHCFSASAQSIRGGIDADVDLRVRSDDRSHRFRDRDDDDVRVIRRYSDRSRLRERRYGVYGSRNCRTVTIRSVDEDGDRTIRKIRKCR